MAVSAERIESPVLADLLAQKDERRKPSADVIDDLQQQKRLRSGDVPENTLPGLIQGAGGVVENFAQMVSAFASAIPGAAAGVGAVLGSGDINNYTEAFTEQADKTTYEPRSQKGKRYEAVIADTYNEYITEKWGNEYLGGLVGEGRITPEEATYYRTAADALLIGLFMRAGSYAKSLGGKAADVANRGRIVDIDAGTDVAVDIYKPGTGQVTAIGEAKPKLLEGPQKKLPKPEEAQLVVAIRQALDGAEPKLLEAPEAKNIFKNRQAGAVDLEVFAEGVRIMLQPGVRGAKVAADISHALARQVAFKHVSDIRTKNSPTAKMLADRIMPSENSTIPLGGGFHELVSLKEGDYSTRVEAILEPLHKHVINKNASKTLRLVALPKSTNDAIFRGMDTGKVRADLVPAVKALRAIMNDLYAYQVEAGVSLGYLENQMPHVWNARKISKAEFGRKKGGAFTKYLVEEEGLSFDAAQGVISTLTHEDGFLEFIDDSGGRLHEGDNFSEWSGRIHRVGGGSSTPGHAKHRVLKGEFDKAQDWLVTDVEAVLSTYINRAVRHAEYVRLAGDGESKLNQMVRQIIEEEQFAGQQGGTLRASSPHTTAQEIYDVFDALQGRFHQIPTPSVRSGSKAVAGFEVIQKLGLVALAQFPETMMPAAKYRVATATKALPGIPIPLKSYGVGMADSAINAMSAASKILTGRRVIPKTETRKHLERIGVIYASSLQSSATRMAGPTGIITNRVIRGFGMEAITNLQRTISLDTINSMIRENARYLSKGLAQGTRYKMYRQELIELGLNPDEVVAWYRDGMPKDHPISTKFDIAHVRSTDTTIIMPKAANAPRLYNDPRFQLPLIFTRFFTVFGNTVMKHIGKKLVSGDVTSIRKLGSIGSILAAIGIAYYTQFLREEISGYKYREDDDPMRIVDAIDRSGLTAMFTRLYPLFSEYKYGMGSQWVANMLGGPFAGDVAGFIAAANGSNEQRARYMAKMTPIMTITPESEDLMYDFYLEMIDGLPEGN